ncbi:MAG: VOC family protein [Candidatus Krumholzibacteria bacterium]|nr:VOC family protein [Candidatus Krumholzibacteria bacterium]
MKPTVTGILETVLYVDDVGRALAFYENLFCFKSLFATERAAGLDVAGRQVLLLFEKKSMLEPAVSKRGTIPPHDGDGHLHMAFAIPADALEAWEKRLAARKIPVTARYQWPRGGQSLYFEDPDGHVIELVTPGCWKTY